MRALDAERDVRRAGLRFVDACADGPVHEGRGRTTELQAHGAAAHAHGGCRDPVYDRPSDGNRGAAWICDLLKWERGARMLVPEERRMAFHHVAIATRDLRKNHTFYTEAMGFRLVKVEPGKTESGGWMKHLFYDTGGEGMIAFWDLHDESISDDWDPAIATGTGLPRWTNHLAWNAEDLDDLARKRDRWLDFGHDVVEIDHYWCVSIYTVDPNGIMVEFCTTTKPFSAEDEARALELLEDPQPELVPPPRVKVHRAGDARSTE